MESNNHRLRETRSLSHLAGDALLRRLGRNLDAACAGDGLAARLGGDEFCVLLPAHTPVDEVHALLHEALSDEGEGFHITAASGVAAVPEEAGDCSAALRLADIRMYAAKVTAHPSLEHAISFGADADARRTPSGPGKPRR